MPVKDDRQVPAPRQGLDLVGVDVGAVGVTAEVGQVPGSYEVAHRCGRHSGPAERERFPQRLVQPLRGPERGGRSPQGSPYRFGVHRQTQRPAPASAAETRPEATAHRQAATVTFSRLAAPYSSNESRLAITPLYRIPSDPDGMR
ncbi:hypothetical protein ACFUVQ_00065 [Streptomyces rochei]|uniref:hypothetical protein n=1 Tax=Streptomyces rochei TaxID=1928 RepID=UPI0036400A93